MRCIFNNTIKGLQEMYLYWLAKCFRGVSFSIANYHSNSIQIQIITSHHCTEWLLGLDPLFHQSTWFSACWSLCWPPASPPCSARPRPGWWRGSWPACPSRCAGSWPPAGPAPRTARSSAPSCTSAPSSGSGWRMTSLQSAAAGTFVRLNTAGSAPS